MLDAPQELRLIINQLKKESIVVDMMKLFVRRQHLFNIFFTGWRRLRFPGFLVT